jgi:DNA sulfur modification protein DndD
MYLRSLTLRNWKAFEECRLDFGEPTARKNVVLIGGKNGYGKTSLFEAIALGLYGRDGLRLVQRATQALEEDRKTQSFREFLGRAFNGRAVQRGQTSCSVGLQFVGDDGQPIEIERTWYFTSSGALQQADPEQLRIFKGPDRRVVRAPPSEPDSDAWYRDWLARSFLPAHLAGFFLFDGEMASAYAERDMGVQVREGIEGLLGLVWFGRLADSLRKYAINRSGQVVKGIDAERIGALEEAIASAENEIGKAKARLTEIEQELANLTTQQDALMAEFASYGGSSAAELQHLLKQRADHEKELRLQEEALARIAELELPLALAGATLRERLSAQLAAEAKREQWHAAAGHAKERAKSVVHIVDDRLLQVEPPLSKTQREAVREAVREALEHLWHPAPEGAAREVRHAHVSGQRREELQVRLREAAQISAGSVNALIEAKSRSNAALRGINREIESSEVMATPQLEAKREQLKVLQQKLGGLRQEEGELRAFVKSREAELDQKRKDLQRQRGLLGQSERPARLAKRAEDIAAMLDRLVKDALPMQTGQIAQEMTEAIAAMAHKKDQFRRVEIGETGEVRLLGPNGRDLRAYDLSAGEKQIFTQALFAAVAAVSERCFPLVVDTPLGRLDEEHRLGVLRYLAKRPGQVILISTDTEVVGPYLDAIRDRVERTWRLENRTEGELGRSWAVRGYFPGQGF